MNKAQRVRAFIAAATLLCFILGLFLTTSGTIAPADVNHSSSKLLFAEKVSTFCTNLHEENLSNNLDGGHFSVVKISAKVTALSNDDREAVLLQAGVLYGAGSRQRLKHSAATRLIYPFHYHW